MALILFQFSLSLCFFQTTFDKGTLEVTNLKLKWSDDEQKVSLSVSSEK